jgi:hypothetical protein
MQLSAEMLELVHDGAGPIRMRDRNAYFALVVASLHKAPVLSPAAVLDAIRVAQGEVLRPAASMSKSVG